MPRKRNSLKHDLMLAATKNVSNNTTMKSYRRSIKRFALWAKSKGIKTKNEITEEVIQQYQIDLKNDPKDYSAATIHNYLAPVCKAAGINMNRIRKEKRTSNKIIRGRKMEQNQQGKHQENDPRFARIINFQNVVGIRRSELKKLKGSDLKCDQDGNYYVLVKRGKGGKYQEQLILPKDVSIVLNTFKNIQSDEFVFSDEEMNNLINFHKMRAQHAREAYTYFLENITKNKHFESRLRDKLIALWEDGHQKLKEQSLDRYIKQRRLFIYELRNTPYKLRGTNSQKAFEQNMPTTYNRLALMAVSVFQLSHWRLCVTVTNYML